MIRSLLLTMMILVVIVCIFGTIIASASTDTNDAMAAINADSELTSYRQGSVVSLSNDGYIGIPVDITVFYNSENSAISGAESTPVVLYVVNSGAARVGTDSDTKIIKSMINCGYAVAVCDFKNSQKAVSPDLDWSCQGLRNKLKNGDFFTDKTVFPAGTYLNSFVVAAGCDLSIGNVFWEIDKHSTDGTLEKIVEVWNYDFRGVHGEKLVKWVDGSGNRKSTQNGFDGSAPVWLNASGEADENGEYIKIKHTLANVITDCTKADGSPIDLNLYMHVIYPTGGVEVPVLALAGSAEHLANGAATADRPQLVGATLRGYAAVTYDHGYVPMARDDHYGYFDGNSAAGHVTGDNNTYSIQFYNNIEINTAAMRYIRYLSLTNEEIAIDSDAIGVYGNSKGGWMTFLGEEDPFATPLRRVYPGHYGETRYDNGDTADNGIIDGGEEQPWLVYGGNTIDSRANLIYCACGGADESITNGHAPTFITCNKRDPSYYTGANNYVNVCRIGDVPALWFEADLGHTFGYGEDLNYGVDIYSAFFSFTDYWLMGNSVQVAYADYSPSSTCAPVVIKFTGSVSAEEVKKITVASAQKSADGYWTAAFGNTEWTFHPYTLDGNTEYTVTVPAGVKGDNGVALASAYSYSFKTPAQDLTIAEVSLVKGVAGTYTYFTKPTCASDDEQFGRFVLRFFVDSDNANTLDIYALDGFDPSAPDSATVGALVASVPVSAKGYYDVDLSDSISAYEDGKTVAFLAKEGKAAAEKVVYSSTLDGKLGSGMSMGGSTVYELANAPDGNPSLKINGFSLYNGYKYETYYGQLELSTIMANFAVLGNGNALTYDDVGRTFRVSFKVYDTETRYLTALINSCTSSSAGIADYNAHTFNIITEKDKWVEVSFIYTVYEPSAFGDAGLAAKRLMLKANGFGEKDAPLYLDDFTTVELTGNVDVASCELVTESKPAEDPCATPYGVIPEAYSSKDDYPFVLFEKNGTSYTFLGATANVFADSYVTTYRDSNYETIVYMRRDFTITTRFTNLRQVKVGVTFDLGENTLTANSSSQSYYVLGNAPRHTVSDIFLNFTNGTIMTDSAKAFILIGSNAAGGTVTYNVGFKNVKFVRPTTTTNAHPIVEFTNSTSTFNTNITYENCTFDMRGATFVLRVFTAGNSQSTATANVVVKGGSLILSTTEKVALTYVSGTGSSVKFAEGEGGFMTLSLPVGSASPTFSVTTVDGKSLGFVKTGSAEFDVYGILDLSTPYGNIPAQYASATDYPFVLFTKTDTGYTFNTATDNIFADSFVTKYRDVNGDTVVYLRRDYTATSIFTNLRQVKGAVTYDLGGHTITAYDGGSFPTYYVNAAAKRHATPVSSVSFINGTILTCKKPFLRVGSSATGGDGTVYSVVFDGITFRRAEGSSGMYPFVEYSGSLSSFSATVSYLDCTFDLGKTIPSTGLTLFPSGNSAGTLVGTVIVKGGRIISPAAAGLRLVNALNTESSVVFGEGKNGYTSIALPAGSAAPTESINLVGGLTAAYTEKTEGSGEYSICPLVTLDFKVLGNLVLYSDFVYNLYVPKLKDVNAIFIDGKEYTYLNTKTIDGKEYCVVSIPVVPSEALKEMELTVKFGSDESVLEGTWKVGVGSYLIKLAESDDTAASNLAKNALSYIRAVYAFKDIDDSSVDLILGEGYDAANKPNTSVSAAIRTDGASAAALELSSAPCFVIYVKDGYTPEQYDFAIAGKRPEWTVGVDGEGRTYISVKVYAYAMTETLTWGVADTGEYGEYNLKAYYEFALSSEDQKLVDLVERLWKYCESALEYRNSVLA